ncbi:hypothetical protein K1T71_000408 [Dendrolimus kikuchii]|uniref:Uncharacterized protein n=1 Tax=Dendrolimus kikuchii TaxID=765133 RepID=A0ACC1DJM0_9NEOP|nr:hypothetical protein K1T71_000408 [Dendrolimus kikuchii]
MNRSRVKNFSVYSILLLIFFIVCQTHANNEEYTLIVTTGSYKLNQHDVYTLDRERRGVPAGVVLEAPSTIQAPTGTPSSPATPAIVVSTTKTTDNGLKTTTSVPGPTPVVSVTQTPLLGENGTGILKRNSTAPKVSDPIDPDDSILDVFKETPKTIMTEHHLQNLTIDTNGFYNISVINKLDYFTQFWSIITKRRAYVHDMLSDSYRRATTIPLKFSFPFYGHLIQNVTVATGGFLYIGEHIHNWLAATQYIAPLMCNFDTTNDSSSVIKLSDDGEKFTVFWENVKLLEDQTKKFTFSVTLFKNGDIVFAYKKIPVDIGQIADSAHPVKIGISDAYLTDNIAYHVRSKIVYEYNRVSLKDYVITNNTIIRLTALPTCLQYNNCYDCVNHDTYFNCTWCPQIQKCSSGTDRNKQNWDQRKCNKTAITHESRCPVSPVEHLEPYLKHCNTTYIVDTEISNTTETIIKTVPYSKSNEAVTPNKTFASLEPTQESHSSSIGGIVALFLVLTIVSSLIAWVLYAFKNPHTRSGQLLIRYRPSQWNWRRGEARYTAATIHM